MARSKVLIITNYAPPLSAGSPIMLGRLLNGLPPESYTLLTNRVSHFIADARQGEWLPGRYHFLGHAQSYTGRQLARKNLALTTRSKSFWLPKLLTGVIDVWRVSRQAQKIIKKEKISSVLATSDMGIFLIGAYLAVRQTALPFSIYLFDLYAGNAYPLPIQLVARFMEPRLFARAQHIFVTSHHTKQYLQQKYHLPDTKFVISPHPSPEISCSRQRTQEKKQIVYTGAMYWAQLPNLRDLVRATESLPNTQVRIHGPVTPEAQAALTPCPNHVLLGPLPHADAVAAQCQADILFLPMAFTGPSRDILATASPGKLAEYLAIGKPILVYAPHFSHVARYAREEGFALVVDQSDPKVLRREINRLLTNKTLQQQLIRQAKRIRTKNHQFGLIQKQFTQTLLESSA